MRHSSLTEDSVPEHFSLQTQVVSTRHRALTRPSASRLSSVARAHGFKKDAETRHTFKELQGMLLAGRPGLCDRCVMLWSLLAQTAPGVMTVTRCAELLGYRNRYQLSRWLGRHGYPPFLELLDWVRVLAWLLEADRGATSLVRQAWADGVEPSVCYRTVRRLTGANWTHTRELGLDFRIELFRTRFREPVCRRSRIV